MRNPLILLWHFRRMLCLVLPPLVFLPLLFSFSKEYEKQGRCGYVMLIMAVYWVTEVVPIAVTSLIPLVMMPMLGLVKSEDLAPLYMKDVTMMFVGGLVMALAIEKWNLHRRTALRIILLVGTKPRFLMLGFMLPTWILSMFISNTATTTIMVPIVQAVLAELAQSTTPTPAADAIVEEAAEQRAPTLLETSLIHSRDQSRAPSRPQSRAPSRAHSRTGSTVSASNSELPSTTDRTQSGSVASAPYATQDEDMHETAIAIAQPADVVVSPAKSVSEQHVAEQRASPRDERSWSSSDASVHDVEREAKKMRDPIAKGFFLAVCYSASIGGLATLTGTGPNLVLKNSLDNFYRKYKDQQSPLSFASFMLFALPCSAIFLIFTWLWLQLLFIGFPWPWRKNKAAGNKLPTTPTDMVMGSTADTTVTLSTSAEATDSGEGAAKAKKQESEKKRNIRDLVQEEYNKLGRICFGEGVVIVLFVLLVLLWLTRSPGFVEGWQQLFEPGMVSDTTPAILVALLLFAVSARLPKPGHRHSAPQLISWQLVAEGMPWGVLILLGGGFALSKAAEDSQLSDLLGSSLVKLVEGANPFVLSLVLSAMAATLTEFTSNTATATLLMPVMVRMSVCLQRNPLQLMLTCALSCSFAFMLPIATPPNAIVFGYGYLKVVDMIRVGIVMNLIGLIVVVLSVNTWAHVVFDLSFVNATIAC